MSNEAFEAWWTESPENLSKAALGSAECELHRRTWNAATERAAKQVEAVGPNEGPLALVTAGFAAAIRARTGGEQT